MRQYATPTHTIARVLALNSRMRPQVHAHTQTRTHAHIYACKYICTTKYTLKAIVDSLDLIFHMLVTFSLSNAGTDKQIH